jgi:hypothetical protein
MTREQNAVLATLTSQYIGAVQGLDQQQYLDKKELQLTDLSDRGREPFYKYVSEETWGYIKAGSFQFGSAEYYRMHENRNIRDQLEGASTFHLADGFDQLNCSIVSGFNCPMFCGTTLHNLSSDGKMRANFGEKLIKIDPLPAFTEAVSRHLGAFRTRTHDVFYTDTKSYLVEDPAIHQFMSIHGSDSSSDLTNMKLRRINKHFFQIFYEVGLLPSLFTKPSSYRHEMERRIVFELESDLRAPTVIVRDRSLLDFVSLVND